MLQVGLLFIFYCFFFVCLFLIRTIFTEGLNNFLNLFRINLREFRFAQTLIFATEEINNSSSLLPNISAGYKIFDTCGLTLPSTRTVMGLINGRKGTSDKTCSNQASLHAIIGASESSSTIVMLQISGIFQIPLVITYICIFL